MTGAGTRLRGESVVIALAAALLAAALTHTGALWRWDRVIYDWALGIASAEPSPEVVIAAVDEHSLAALGRWPWPRSVHAALLDRLSEAGAGSVGYAILFAEPDPEPENDLALAAAMRRHGRVVMPVIAESGRAGEGLKVTYPLPVVADAAAALGHVDMEVDPDGVVRRTYLRAGLGDAYWPALAAVLAGRVAPAPPAQGRRELAGDGVPWRREGEALIPFSGPPGHYPRYSVTDILSGVVERSLLRDRVVLVGVTAAGLGNPLPTPVSGAHRSMPSVEVLANLYQGLREERVILPLEPMSGALLAALLVLLPALGHLLLRHRSGAVVAPLAMLAPLVLSVAALAASQLWWPPLGAVAAAALCFALIAWRQLEASRREVDAGRRRAAVTLHSIGDAVVTVDPSGHIDYMNPAAEALTGWRAPEAAGRSLGDVVKLVDANESDALPEALERAVTSGESVATSKPVTLLGREGSEFGVYACAAPIADGSGDRDGLVLAIRDVTEARRLEREMAHRASHDDLTDLPNRSLLLDRLDTALARAIRSGDRVAVMFVDVDRFKLVNDGFGHGFGDSLLKQLAVRLRDGMRAQDTVARLGGDEFVVLLEAMHDEQDVSSASRKLLESISRPYIVDGRETFVTASVGVAVFPKDGVDAGELLRNADAAMYRAKDSGRNAVQFYSEEMNERVLRRVDIEHRLRRAFGSEALAVHYQPLVALREGVVTGAEALLRWTDPELGRISPGEFVSVAEESGLIGPMGEWVLESACEQARCWESAGIGSLRMSVNVSPRQLLRDDMPRIVSRVLASSGLSPERLELEITENMMMREADRYERTLHELKDLGVHIAIDDFGTGYSSLSYLKRFPVNRVKIDRSFVRDIGSTGEGTAISRAVIAMAQSLELGVVAEGLERAVQRDFLRDRRCDEGQGFFLAPPLASGELEQLLRRHGGRLPESGFGVVVDVEETEDERD